MRHDDSSQVREIVPLQRGKEKALKRAKKNLSLLMGRRKGLSVFYLLSVFIRVICGRFYLLYSLRFYCGR
jgi:hypothetical protein